MSAQPAEWVPPDEIEEYRLVRELGRGAMGRVYLARDRLLDRPVAIKFIARAVLTEGARERFFVEARAVARLSHPNVVAVHRVAELRGRPFLVSEYVRGRSLAELEKPLGTPEVLAIATDLSRGLAAAHRRGVLHRDIKPANAIRAEDGTTKLLDFGLAELDPERTPDGPIDPPARPAASVTGQDDNKYSGRALVSTVDVGEPRGTGASPEPVAASRSRPRLAGTPLYMAPEIWRGEAPTPRADVYSLGALIYELCAGRAPYADRPADALAHSIQSEDAPPLRTVAPAVDEGLAVVVDRCLRRDPASRYSDGDALRDALETLHERRGARPRAPEGNPYRGLFVFEAEHRDLFFGRRSEALTIVERLRSEPLIVVAGDSGTGKSSLCRAGVLPLIEGGALGPDIESVHVPLGRRPLSSLASALAPLAGADEADVLERLRHEPLALARDLRKSGRGVVLFLDQLEELCSLAAPEESALVAEALHALADRSSGVRALATARSDFLTRLAALPGLGEDLPAALYLLRPLATGSLREVVVSPAAAKGFVFESEDVVRALVDEAQRADGALPLLQFALSELWEARDPERRLIPASALARIGGVTGALARHADGVLAGLPQAERTAAREILLSLVTAEGTRARRTRTELLELAAKSSPRGAEALEALVRGRLLVAREAEAGGDSAFTIAHEALLHGWDTLSGWLGRDAEGRALRQRIERAAAEWERLGHADDALWKDRLLAEAAGVDEGALASREAEFLRTARRAAARRRLQRWALPIGLAVALAAAVLGIRVKAARDRDLVVVEARGMLASARNRRETFERLRREAFDKFDTHQGSEAEQIWSKALLAAPGVQRAYAETGEKLQRLLQEDPGHEGARALLADVLYERASLADEGSQPAERDELIRTLGLYGAGDRWSTPARLSVETRPPGAEVKLARYELSDGRWVESAPEPLGDSPVAERALPPGSSLLSFSLAGRVPVRLPILLLRGEATRVLVDLPAPSEVPDGFVYVPAGRFLYGSAGGEDARVFYSSQPIHPVETGSYLIARNETTYGDWLKFLGALPPEERLRRTPSATRQGFTVALAELPDGAPQITLGMDEFPQSARAGEKIRYRGRTRRAEQDWLRIPITSVSFEDVIAYAAWLDHTGRVPGARPCTEHEWERAARGADGRAYPSGERLEPDDANRDVTYGRVYSAFGPDEVGSHPASDSPFGVHDLAGNVWEWTASVDDPKTPAARGGGFFQFDAVARCENRAQDVPGRRDTYYGVRMCASVRSP